MNTSLPHHSARREIKFLFTQLNELIPTNADCYLTACNGSYCIIDRYRPAIAGSRVLVELAGKCDWARVAANPERIITDDGLVLTGDLLDDVRVIGVAIREVIPTWQDPRPCL